MFFPAGDVDKIHIVFEEKKSCFKTKLTGEKIDCERHFDYALTVVDNEEIFQKQLI